MTNDNTTRKKASAVFFSIVMVLSMAAVGFAAAPAAASTADDVATDSVDTQVAENPTLDKRPLHFVAGDADLFPAAAGLDDGSGALELAFDESVSENNGTITIFDQADDEIANVSLDDDDVVFTNEDNGQVIVNTDELAGEDSDGVFPRVGDIEVEFDDQDDVTDEARFLGQTITESDDTNVFEGTQIAFVGEEVDFSVEISSDSVFATRSTGDNSQIARFNTADRALEDYNVSEGDDAGFGGSAEYTLRDLGLDVEIDDLEITTNDLVEGTASATDSDREVDIDLLDDDGDIVESQTENLGIDAEVDFDFEVEDAGDYTVEVTDLSSGASVESDVIEVSEPEEGDVAFEDSFVSDEQGDIADITIEFEGEQEEAFLRVGDFDDVGYEANITVDSGGEDNVTIGFNTYAAGEEDFEDSLVEVVDDDSDAEVTLENQSTGLVGILAEGTYVMDLSDQGHEEIADDESVDVGDLEIEERSVDDFVIWTTSADAFDDVEDDEDVLDAVDAGTIQQDDSIASGDVLIHDLQASGLEGIIDTGVDEALDDELDSILSTLTAVEPNDAGVDLRVRQTAETTAPNQPRKEVDIPASADAFDIVESDDRYFLVVDPEDFEFVEDNEIEDGDAFNVRLRVKDERLLNVDDDDAEDADDLRDFYDVVTATFSFEDADGEFDEPVEAESADEQVITGTTNAAPGQELTVRVRSASGVSPGFVLTDNEVTTSTDGTFEATLDFSETSVGDEFTATIRQATFDGDADGIVVEAVDEEDDVDEADEEDDVDEADEEDDVDETDEEDDVDETDEEDDVDETDDVDEVDDTEDDTPGFGAVVALVALIAAALLATRRTNN